MQYMTIYFYCTANLGEFFLSPHLLLDHVSINPPNILFYQSCFQLAYALAFLHTLMPNMIDWKQKTEQAREKYCARTTFNHKIHLFESNSSQNSVVFSWDVHFGDKNENTF